MDKIPIQETQLFISNGVDENQRISYSKMAILNIK